MFEILTIRILSGVLLGASILLLVLASRRPREGRTPYVPAAIRRVPRAVHTVWLVASVLVPIAAILIAVIVPQLIYQTALNFAFPGDTSFQAAAILLFGVGGALILWSERHLGRFMVVDIAIAKDHQLITTGPYAYVRHPTYTGVLLLNLAAAVFFLHTLLIVNFLLVLAIASWRARLEEELLSSEQGFGPRYREYVSKTGRFLPGHLHGYE